jgi:hypothetical protein
MSERANRESQVSSNRTFHDSRATGAPASQHTPACPLTCITPPRSPCTPLHHHTPHAPCLAHARPQGPPVIRYASERAAPPASRAPAPLRGAHATPPCQAIRARRSSLPGVLTRSHLCSHVHLPALTRIPSTPQSSQSSHSLSLPTNPDIPTY